MLKKSKCDKICIGEGLSIEPSASHMSGKHCNTELNFQVTDSLSLLQ